jgi:hypothetical protein
MNRNWQFFVLVSDVTLPMFEKRTWQGKSDGQSSTAIA